MLPSSLDPTHLLVLTDNGCDLSVKSVSNSDATPSVNFYCAGILGAYKLSRGRSGEVAPSVEIFIAFITEVKVIGVGITGKPIYQVCS